jgi:hypothetical protein
MMAWVQLLFGGRAIVSGTGYLSFEVDNVERWPESYDGVGLGRSTGIDRNAERYLTTGRCVSLPLRRRRMCGP